MAGSTHVPVHIRRLTGKSPGDHLFCEICGVRWPCLAASDAALERMRESLELRHVVPATTGHGGLPWPDSQRETSKAPGAL